MSNVEPSSSSSEIVRSALIELEQIDQELQRRRKTSGISYFTPNEPQLRSFKSSANWVIYSGGNRAGKSHRGAAELVCHLLRKYPSCSCHGEWFSQRRRFDRPIKAVISATEFPVVERVIEPKILSLLPLSQIAKGGLKRGTQGYLRRIVLVDGSTVDILTAEMDQMAYESADWDIAWIDEPLNREKYTAIRRGLVDRNGIGVMTFTPTVEPWIKDELIDKADGHDIDVIIADSYANTSDIHGKPILSREAIAQFEKAIPEEERETRLYGKFFHLRGIIYKDWSTEVHEREFAYTWPDPVIAILDPHDRIPHHVIWAFVDKQDWLYIDRELVMEGTVENLSKAILEVEARAGYRMRKRLIDPNFGRKPLITTGRTVIDELRRPPYPVSFIEANDDKVAGILKVKDYIKYDKHLPLSLVNSPRLYINRGRCPHTIKSMRNYQYEEWQGATKDRRDRKETPRDKDDHGADCIRYLCMDNSRYESISRASLNTGLSQAMY